MFAYKRRNLEPIAANASVLSLGERIKRSTVTDAGIVVTGCGEIEVAVHLSQSGSGLSVGLRS